MNGNEAIYTGDIESKSVERITAPEEEDHHSPQFSPDGEGLLYLAANQDGVQTIHYKPDLGRDETTQLTKTDSHVFSAAISPDGSKVYYIAMPSKDFGVPEGEAENGTDLHSVNIDGSNSQKLTDKDTYAMNELSISDDGTTLYYTAFQNETQQLFAYNIEDGTESAFLPEHMSDDIYHPVLSPDEEQLAYTAVADTSENGTFLYELFLMEVSTGDSERLTDYNASVTSPAFFHQQNRIAFLAESNWPSEPSSYEIMTVSEDGGGATNLALDLPESSNTIQPGAIADKLVNTVTMTVLYVLLFGLLTVYYHARSNKTYFPAKLSAILTGVVFLGSFAATAYNPWMGIGLFTLAGGLVGCTAVIFVLALIYRRVVRR
ncbi:TolB family protein [Lentibacillus sediminis]|uniref:TolB family protein n=1 Tax=Lentibacillus sediminis TaxID=1940529 RepID=UPI000C1BD5A8|nr:PD40 domain-containing protein [Lentibacillus sediminis]